LLTELKEIGEHPEGGTVFLNRDEYLLLNDGRLYVIDTKEARRAIVFVPASALALQDKDEGENNA